MYMYMERRGDDGMWLREESDVEQRCVVLERRRNHADARQFPGHGTEKRKEHQRNEQGEGEEEEERDVCVQEVLLRGVDNSHHAEEYATETVHTSCIPSTSSFDTARATHTCLVFTALSSSPATVTVPSSQFSNCTPQ